MVLASISGTGILAVIAGYILLILLAYAIWPRDVTGRRRANGCIVSLALFFGIFVVGLAAWAADAIF